MLMVIILSFDLFVAYRDIMFGSVEDVIQKWEKHHSGPPVLLASNAWYTKPSEFANRLVRGPPKRRRRLDGKDTVSLFLK